MSKSQRVIHKYHFPSQVARHYVLMPGWIEPLAFQIQHGVPTLWYLLHLNGLPLDYEFDLVFTGDRYDESDEEQYEYIGTAQDGDIVWHLFQVKATP